MRTRLEPVGAHVGAREIPYGPRAGLEHERRRKRICHGLAVNHDPHPPPGGLEAGVVFLAGRHQWPALARWRRRLALSFALRLFERILVLIRFMTSSLKNGAHYGAPRAPAK